MHDAIHCQWVSKMLAKSSTELYIIRIMKKTNNSNTIEEIRLANLRSLVEECPEYRKGDVAARAGSLAALALFCDTSRSYLSQILIRFERKNGKIRGVGVDLARKLEKGMKKPVGWMDVKHEDIEPAESEFRLIYAAMNEDQKTALLEHAKLISKIGKK